MIGVKLGALIILLACCFCGTYAAVNCSSTGVGRYADPADSACKNHSLCVLQSSSTFLTYNYTCSGTSLFSPTSGLCTTNYTCPTSSTTNTSTSVCTADGYVADPNSTDCSTYIQCVDINGSYLETTLTCPTNTFYDPSTTLCESTYTCSAQTVTCTSAGRIANTTDTTCQNYLLCVVATNGTIIQYSYTCPQSSVFSPLTQTCTTNYTCTN